MKILLTAPQDGHSSLYLGRAFEQLGHQVEQFNYRLFHDEVAASLALMSLTVRNGLTVVLKGELFQPKILSAIHPLVLWDFDLWQQTVPGMETYRNAMHERARAVDYFLTPSDGYFDKEFGIKSHYFPEAADPELHAPAKPLDYYSADVSFIGTVKDVSGRDEWLAKVGKWCDANGKTLKVWGSFPGELSKKWHTGKRASTEIWPSPPAGLAEDIGHNLIVSSSKVILDRQRNPEIRGCISARVFRTMAAKGLVLARHMTGQEELLKFFHGGNCVTYKTDEECVERISQILRMADHESDYLSKIRTDGYNTTMERHLWVHRARDIIKLVGL